MAIASSNPRILGPIGGSSVLYVKEAFDEVDRSCKVVQ
jgi:hypothetical protein